LANSTAQSPIASIKILTASFTLYSTLPAAPTGLSGQSGESEIGAKWSAVNTGIRTRYAVYFDIAGGAGGGGDGGAQTCGSGALIAGKPGPTPDNATVFKENNVV